MVGDEVFLTFLGGGELDTVAAGPEASFVRALLRFVGPFAVLALFFILGLGGGLLQFLQLTDQLVHAFFVHFRCTGRGAVSIAVPSWVDTVAHVTLSLS